MAPLSDRVEFLSDAWLAAAQSFLTLAWTPRMAAAGDQTLWLSASFTNAPRHLKLAGDVAQVSIRLSAQGADVSRQGQERPNLSIAGDYQAALALAQVVGASVPGDMERALREVSVMFGDDAVRMSGAAPADIFDIVLRQLHDYMARRTVENPDLAHRAERQGLTHKLADYQTNGYTVLERAISPALADELRETLLREILAFDQIQSHGLLTRGRVFEIMLQHPLLRTVVEAALGRGAIIASLAGIRKAAGKGIVPLHADYTLIPDPFPEYGLTGVAVWALEDWTVEAGPTWILPGTQERRRSPKATDPMEGGVPILMPKGSVTFFGNGVWHWQGDRSAPGVRVTLHAQYARGFLRPLDALRVDDHMLDRNGPAFSELTGQDDPFEKSGVFGHDMERWDHMKKIQNFGVRP